MVISDTSRELDDVALVLVHGIGAQLRGATLTEWAEPIAQRLNYIAMSEGGEVRVTEARLGGDVPAEVRIEVHRPGRDVKSVLIVEARWAEEFIEQGSAPVIWWAVRFSFKAAWRAATHVVRFGYAMESSALVTAASIPAGVKIRKRTTVALARALFAVPLAICVLVISPIVLATVIVCLGILTLLSLIPIIGAKINPAIRALTSTIGDAATWVTRPVSAAAIRDTVRHSIRQAKRRAHKVIVLGHSQGAAAAVEAILAPDAGPDMRVDKLITVGGAVLLLRSPRWQGTGTVAHFSPIDAWLAKPEMEWINIWGLWDPVSAGPITASPKEVKFRWAECYLHSIEKKWHEKSIGRTLKAISKRISAHPGASHELVQGGDFPLPWKRFKLRKVCVGPEEWPVHNRASLIRDHITYTKNLVQVIDPLAYQLLGEVKPPQERTQNYVRSATEEHQELVRLLGTIKSVALIFAVLVAPLIVQVFSGQPWLEWIREATGRFHDGAGEFFDWMVSTGFSRGALELSLAATASFIVVNFIATLMWSGASHLNSWSRSAIESGLIIRRKLYVLLKSSLCAVLLLLTSGIAILIMYFITHEFKPEWLVLAWILSLPVLLTPIFGARPGPTPARRQEVNAESVHHGFATSQVN